MALCLETASLCSAGNARRLSIISTGSLLCAQKERGCRQTQRQTQFFNITHSCSGVNFNHKKHHKTLPAWILHAGGDCALCPVRPAAAAAANKQKAAGGFFRINVGLIIIRDPITAFVPCLSHLQPMASREKRLFCSREGAQTKIKARRFKRWFLLYPRLSALLLPASPCLSAGVTALAKPGAAPTNPGEEETKKCS